MTVSTIPRYRRNRQRGSAPLISLLIAVGAMAAMIPVFAQLWEDRVVRQSSEAAGKQLAQFSVGVRGLVARIQAGDQALPADQVGANFLKPPSCGGLPGNPSEGYIPCNFGNYDNGNADTLFDGQYTTTFSHDPATDLIEVRTWFFPSYPQKPGYEAVIADMIVNAAKSTPAGSPTGTFANYLANVPDDADDLTNATVDPTDSNFGRVLSIVSNAPASDIYLRIDGANHMEADLDVGGHDIVNTRDVNASRDVNAGQDLSAGRDLDVGGDAIIGGDGQVRGNMLVDLDLATGGNAYFSGDVFANRNVNARGNIVTENNVIADQNFIGEDLFVTNTRMSDGSIPRASQGVFEKRVYNSGSFWVTRPTCRGGSDPLIFTSIQSVSSRDGAPIAGTDIRVTRSGNRWRVLVYVNSSTAGRWVWTPHANVVVSTKCS